MLAHAALEVENPLAEPLPPPSPILKWAGGKTRLMPDILARIPARFGAYHEPFLGGGAVFFTLLNQGLLRSAHLSDLNQHLVDTYTAVRDHTEEVIEALRIHINDKDHYYEVRSWHEDELTLPQKAARFLYLNRTCFNGLYRVNKKGLFNVPFGRYTNPRICNEPALYAARGAFSRATLQLASYKRVLDEAERGDFVYFDPPYAPLSATASFTAYTKEGFGEAAQWELGETCRELDRRGVHWLLSNSDVPLIHDVYEGFTIEPVLAPRSINRDKTKRGKVTEVMVRNY